MNVFTHKLILWHTLFLLLAGLCVPHATFAYFTDGVDAADADFSVGALSITTTQSNTDLAITSNTGGDMSFDTVNEGAVDEQYRITVASVNCAADFWTGLLFSITKEGVLYQDVAGSFVATSTTGGTWDVSVTAGHSFQAAENETCNLVINVTAWQDEFASSIEGGFSDSVSIPLTITAGSDFGQQPTATVVLNEIYPNPDTASSSPLDIEWIELYNGTGASVDVAGWDIGELSGGTENPHTIVGSCSGYSVSDHMEPYGTSNTVIAPGGLLVVQFCGSAGYLNDSGDTVTLRMSTSTAAVDGYTYTSATKGKSIARIPDGSIWVDPIPTPGTPNIATEEELRDAGWNETEIVAVLSDERTNDTKTSQRSAFRFVNDLVATRSSTTAAVTETSFTTTTTQTVSTSMSSGTGATQVETDEFEEVDTASSTEQSEPEPENLELEEKETLLVEDDIVSEEEKTVESDQPEVADAKEEITEEEVIDETLHHDNEDTPDKEQEEEGVNEVTT